MRPVDVALQYLPGELTALDAVPPFLVALLLAGGWWLRWRKQTTSERDQADTSTWRRMQEAREVLVRQRDDALAQVGRQGERVRQLAEHITDLEQRNDQLRGDLRRSVETRPPPEGPVMIPTVGTTQEHHPWRATVRTIQALVAFAAMWVVVVEAAGLKPGPRVGVRVGGRHRCDHPLDGTATGRGVPPPVCPLPRGERDDRG